MEKQGRSIEQQIGARIRARRMELGLIQEQLATALGISYQQIQKYENGSNRITVDRLLLLARRLEVPVAYFFASLPDGGRKGAGSEPRYAGVRDARTRAALTALARSISEREG
jgi:transcriptional regulator with XRE-family HTH domain